MSGCRRARVVAVLAGMLAASAAAGGEATPLPVREVAAGVFVHEAPFTLAQPRNGGAIANAGFIVGEEAVAVIDTEGSLLAGRRLLAAVRARTGLPIRYVVNTHAHPDHTLGNAAFVGDETIFVGHRNLPEALTARAERYLAASRELIGAEAFAGTRIVGPDVVVADRLELDLGKRRLIIEAWPTGHTNSDLTAFDEATGTWFLGDLLFAGHVPAIDGSLAGWLRTVDTIRARKADRVVPGHGPASLPWPAALAPMEHYLRGLQTDVRTMVREGLTMQEATARAGRAEAGGWSLFDEFNPRNVTTTFHELEWE